MSESTALIIELVLLGLCGIGALTAGIVYVKTDERHGGFICLVLSLVTLTLGQEIWDSAQKVLS